MLWPGHTSWGICGNRIWLRSPFGLLDVTLTIRDTTIPDAYSREELLEMVQTVRRHEKIQEWKVPEPSDE